MSSWVGAGPKLLELPSASDGPSHQQPVCRWEVEGAECLGGQQGHHSPLASLGVS